MSAHITIVEAAPPKFPLGRLTATPAALEAASANGVNLGALLARHIAGDWGDVSPDDHAANERALAHGSRLLSAYEVLPSGGVIWIITEADRYVTTVLLPEDC